MICQICLEAIKSSTKYPEYHDKCMIGLFGTVRVSPYLNFDRNEIPELVRAKTTRMSISGVQPKASVLIDEKQELKITDVNGRFILKPTPKDQYEYLSENEHLTMILGQVHGIDTPPLGLVQFKNGEKAFIIKRFDRTEHESKLGVEDMTQLLELPRDGSGNFKYERSYEEVGKKIREVTGGRLIEVQRFMERLIFRYLVGDGDYHLKNISVIKTVSSRSHYYDTLSPNYDAVCTKLYFKDETDFAIDLLSNQEYTESFQQIGFFTKSDFLELGKRLELNQSVMKELFRKFQKRSPRVVETIERSYLPDDKKIAYRGIYEERMKRLQIA